MIGKTFKHWQFLALTFWLAGCSSADFGSNLGTRERSMPDEETVADDAGPTDADDVDDDIERDPVDGGDAADGPELDEGKDEAAAAIEEDFEDGEITFDEDSIVYKKTKTIAVVFEDSKNPKAWQARDIRVCVKGKFAYDASSKTFRGGTKKPQVLEINSYKNPNAACRHRFVIEVRDKDGKKLREEGVETNPNPDFSAIDLTLGYGEEMILSWEWISGDQCRIFGRDSHKRTTSNPTPPPKTYFDSCGDFSR